MKKAKLSTLIKNNFIFISFLSNCIFHFVQAYYVFPFKILKPDLSSLYKSFPNNTKEEVYLSYLNLGTIYTYVKTENSKIFELIFKVNEKCSFQTNTSCITNYKSNIFDKFSHNNIHISNVINSILDNPPKEECTDIKIGLAMSGYKGKDKCISIVNTIKENDHTTNSTSYYFKFYNKEEINKKGFDGEIILGAEPYIYESNIYKEDDFVTVYNHVNDYYYNDFWDGKYINYSFYFEKVYYYIDNNNQSENIRFVQGSDSNEAAIDFESGLIKAPSNYYSIIVATFFDQYIKDNICKETTISGGFKGIICYKTKLNAKLLYEHFPTIYFDNVNLNFTFSLNSNDLFIENNEIIYFVLISQNEKINNWRFGQQFLKKYKLVFNNDKKAIGCFIKSKKESNGEIIEDNNNGNKDKKDKKIHYGIIILIIGIILFIGEVIVAVVCIKKYNCLNRRKRANELMDDNYDYPTVNSDENKAIN